MFVLERGTTSVVVEIQTESESDDECGGCLGLRSGNDQLSSPTVVQHVLRVMQWRCATRPGIREVSIRQGGPRDMCDVPTAAIVASF